MLLWTLSQSVTWLAQDSVKIQMQRDVEYVKCSIGITYYESVVIQFTLFSRLDSF